MMIEQLFKLVNLKDKLSKLSGIKDDTNKNLKIVSDVKGQMLKTIDEAVNWDKVHELFPNLVNTVSSSNLIPALFATLSNLNSTSKTIIPKSSLYIQNNTAYLTIELPGIQTKEEISLHAEKNIIKIKANKIENSLKSALDAEINATESSESQQQNIDKFTNDKALKVNDKHSAEDPLKLKRKIFSDISYGMYEKDFVIPFEIITHETTAKFEGGTLYVQIKGFMDTNTKPVEIIIG